MLKPQSSDGLRLAFHEMNVGGDVISCPFNLLEQGKKMFDQTGQNFDTESSHFPRGKNVGETNPRSQ